MNSEAGLGIKDEAFPSREDLQVRQVAQNERIIELLEQLVAAPKQTDAA